MDVDMAAPRIEARDDFVIEAVVAGRREGRRGIEVIGAFLKAIGDGVGDARVWEGDGRDMAFAVIGDLYVLIHDVGDDFAILDAIDVPRIGGEDGVGVEVVIGGVVLDLATADGVDANARGWGELVADDEAVGLLPEVADA